MKKKKKGFTLVELLAVIVILAIILVIAVPQIMNIITESRKGALVSSAKLIAASAENMKLSNDTLGINKTITCPDVSKFNNDNYESCDITFDSNGKAQVTIVGKGKFEGMSVCSATRETGEVSSECTTDVSCFAYEETQQVTSFLIDEGKCMTYIKNQNRGFTEADIITFCKGGELDGLTMKEAIDEGIFTIEELKSNDVIYNVQSVDVISITGYSETCPKDVIIPSKINNKTVTTIGDYAFTTSGVIPTPTENDLLYQNYGVSTLDAKSYNENILPIGAPSGMGITSVTIPNSVTYIGDYAFQGNQLTSITIPDSVTTIGIGALSSNQLTSITIPDSVTTIGIGALSSNQLTSITIPDSVTSIGDSAFDSNHLTSVTIPNSVTTIGSSVFANNKLTRVTIPNSVTYIDGFAFADNQLTEVNFPTIPLTLGCDAFVGNPIYDTLEYPSNVTYLGCDGPY